MPDSFDYPRWFGSLARDVQVRLKVDTILPAGPDEALACGLGPPQPGPPLEVAGVSPIVEYEVWTTLPPEVPR